MTVLTQTRARFSRPHSQAAALGSMIGVLSAFGLLGPHALQAGRTAGPAGAHLLPAAPAHARPASEERQNRVPLRQLVGQSIMTAFAGRRVDRDLLARIRRGEIGGLIVFGANYVHDRQLRRAISTAQAAARAGGNPPLLIATDQEGGSVRRLPNAPPLQSPAALAKLGTQAVASQAALAGKKLRAVGVNVDLAPVVDVPASPASFLGSRAFASNPALVARLGGAFVVSLQRQRVAATAKHFPGLGTAVANTDTATVTITSSRSELRRRLLPFRAAVRAGVKLVMVSSATYTAYDRRSPAALSDAIVKGVLRDELGFRGVVITDSLESPAIVASPTPAARALKAGVDVLLYTSEADGKYTFGRLLAEAHHDRMLRQRLAASYRRIVALKAWLRPR